MFTLLPLNEIEDELRPPARSEPEAMVIDPVMAILGISNDIGR